VNSNYHEKYPSWNKHNHCSSTCVELKLWGSTKEKKIKIIKNFLSLRAEERCTVIVFTGIKK